MMRQRPGICQSWLELVVWMMMAVIFAVSVWAAFVFIAASLPRGDSPTPDVQIPPITAVSVQ